jgi:hypothetical protein
MLTESALPTDSVPGGVLLADLDNAWLSRSIRNICGVAEALLPHIKP